MTANMSIPLRLKLPSAESPTSPAMPPTCRSAASAPKPNAPKPRTSLAITGSRLMCANPNSSVTATSAMRVTRTRLRRIMPTYSRRMRSADSRGASRLRDEEGRANSRNPADAMNTSPMNRNCAPAPNDETMTPDSSDPKTMPICILTELSDIPLSASSRPTMS